MSIISEILTVSEGRLQERMRSHPLVEVKAAAAEAPRSSGTLLGELRRQGFSLIAELKRRSPSTGAMDRANVDRALEVYRSCPEVAAISILTNEDHFGNSLADLRRARALTTKPLLRKDFILHEYQVWEARAAGADAILLMAGLLPDATRARDLYQLAVSLGMDAIFEIGMGKRAVEEQALLVPSAAPIWGINSRHFSSSRLGLRARLGRLLGKDFWTSRDRHRDLKRHVPSGKIVIAESGLHQPTDLRALPAMGYHAALIGTAFLREGADVEATVAAFASQTAALRKGLSSLNAAEAGVNNSPVTGR